MEKFIQQNKGPLLAMGSAAVGLVLLLLISALVNLPQPAPAAAPSENVNPNIWQNLFWLLLVGGGGAAVVLFIRRRQSRHETDEPSEEVALTLADRPDQLVQEISALFGTTDMNQITTGIQAMYAELTELREGAGSDQDAPEDLTTKVSEQERIITALANERDQAQAASERWQAKAISSTQEVSGLRQEMKEHGKWQPLTEAELASFFPTVTIKDGNDHKAFLNSKRRQRRLMQRLSAEGYSIVCPVK